MFLENYFFNFTAMSHHSKNLNCLLCFGIEMRGSIMKMLTSLTCTDIPRKSLADNKRAECKKTPLLGANPFKSKVISAEN